MKVYGFLFLCKIKTYCDCKLVEKCITAICVVPYALLHVAWPTIFQTISTDSDWFNIHFSIDVISCKLIECPTTIVLDDLSTSEKCEYCKEENAGHYYATGVCAGEFRVL